MNLLINKIIKHLENKESKWSEIEILKMQLGFQILIHNFFMICFIIILSAVLQMLLESMILLISYGVLKVNAGGIHFKKSSLCLLSTCIFVICGVVTSRHIYFPFYLVLFIYISCIITLWIIGPQGTKNNPILPHNYCKMKRNTIFLSFSYFIITIYTFITTDEVPYLLFIAIVFETVSLLPNKLKSKLKS